MITYATIETTCRNNLTPDFVFSGLDDLKAFFLNAGYQIDEEDNITKGDNTVRVYDLRLNTKEVIFDYQPTPEKEKAYADYKREFYARECITIPKHG